MALVIGGLLAFNALLAPFGIALGLAVGAVGIWMVRSTSTRRARGCSRPGAGPGRLSVHRPAPPLASRLGGSVLFAQHAAPFGTVGLLLLSLAVWRSTRRASSLPVSATELQP